MSAGSGDAGLLLDAAAMLPSVEELADRVMEFAEDAPEAEALEAVAIGRVAMLDVLER